MSRNVEPQAMDSEARETQPRETQSRETQPRETQPSSKSGLKPTEKRLLTMTAKKPKLVLSDERFENPELSQGYLDICDNKSLTAPWDALEYASIALEHGRRSGDPHLWNRSRGVFVHACMASDSWPRAGQVLAELEHDAIGCCSLCRGDWLRRKGDFLAELRDAKTAQWYLERSLEELGDKLDDDLRGRIVFVRALVFHYQGWTDRALDDVETVLLVMPLDSPRGYFLDTVAFLACYMPREETLYDLRAVGILDRFEERLKGGRDWGEVLARVRWLKAILYVRLGGRQNLKRAFCRFNSALGDLPTVDLPRELAGLSVDFAQVRARRADETDLKAIERLLDRCVRLRPDLREELREGLKKVISPMKRHPREAFRILWEFRRSFVTPVPGLLSPKALAKPGRIVAVTG
jgi:hypothetical protein